MIKSDYKTNFKYFIKKHTILLDCSDDHVARFYKFYRATYFVNCVYGYNKKYEKIMHYISIKVKKDDIRDVLEQITLKKTIMKPRFRNYMKACKLMMEGEK